MILSTQRGAIIDESIIAKTIGQKHISSRARVPYFSKETTMLRGDEILGASSTIDLNVQQDQMAGGDSTNLCAIFSTTNICTVSVNSIRPGAGLFREPDPGKQESPLCFIEFVVQSHHRFSTSSLLSENLKGGLVPDSALPCGGTYNKIEWGQPMKVNGSS
jgi:hypothetical protein